MAQQAPEPPETIVLGSFTGIKNTVNAERLTPAELEAAVNVDIDDVGQMRRRRGYERVATGDFHSLYSVKDRLFAVKDGDLGLVSPNGFTFTTLVSGVGTRPLSYTSVKDLLFYASEHTSGKIDADNVPHSWGTPGAGEWVSPVLRPTDTLGAIRGRLVGAPPLATEIEAYSGRIYLAHENVVWATDLYFYDQVDKTRTFMQLEKDVTLLAAVDDGLYVGTESGLFFLKGVLSAGMQLTQLTSKPVLRGSKALVPAHRVHPMAKQSPQRASLAVMLMATDGVYACFNGGEAYNLTEGRVVFPNAVRAAALYRDFDGGTTFVVATDSAGDPRTTARIGDFVDAEIRRIHRG